jgi:MFS family permease
MAFMDTTMRSIVLSLYLPTLFLSFATGMLTPIMPLYARSFEISYALVGLVLAAQGMGNLIGDIPAGIVLGKLGHKVTMLIGVSMFGLSITAMSWANSVPQLVIFGLLAGIGNALWNISRHAYMTGLIPLERRGRVSATFGGINRIGTFLGPLLGATVAAVFGLRVPFLIFGVVTVIAFILSALFVNEATEPRTSRGGVRGHTRHLAQVARAYAGILTTAGIAQLLAQMIRTGRNSIIPLYAADVVGLDVQAIGWIVTLSAAIDMAMFYPAGVIMDRFGRKFASVPSFLIQGIGMALVPLTFSFETLLMATLVIGFGNGIGSGTMLTLGSDLAPKESMGEFLGVWRLIGDAGSTAAPIAVGSVADLVGLAMSALVLGGVGIGAAALLLFFVPETLRRPAVVAVKPSPGD